VRGKAIVPLVLLTAACTHQSEVPTVSGASLATIGDRQQGGYVASVKTGGWSLTVDKFSIEQCGYGTFKADLDPAWHKMTKKALTSALERVDFVSDVPGPSELAANRYRASFNFTQSSAKIREGFLVGAAGLAIAVTDIEATLVATWPDGRMQQFPLAGHGTVSADSGIFCSHVDKVVGDSGSLAVQDLVKQAVLVIKLALAQSARQ
jgi:hypothetical protein